MHFPLRVMSLHDVHLGHHSTPARHILKSLYQTITVETLSKIDILLMAGDWYDRVLLHSDPDVFEILAFDVHLLNTARTTGTTILLLKGTPSHDGDQPNNLYTLAKTSYPDVDLRYYTDMVIDTIEKYDCTVMTVPDEWGTREDMYLKAQSLLKEHQLEKVDFILGHNQFGYQFLPHIRQKISTLNEEDWSNMINFTGFFGHVHKRSSYKHIEVAGSLDRLCHGEEDAKGYLIGEYRSEDDWSIQFIENKDAAIYKTLSLPKLDNPTEDLYRSLQPTLDELSQHPCCHIRFAYYGGQFPIKDFIKQMKLQYPLVKFTAKRLDDPDETSSTSVTLLPDESHYETMALTRDNIERLVIDQLPTDISQASRDRVMALFARYLN